MLRRCISRSFRGTPFGFINNSLYSHFHRYSSSLIIGEHSNGVLSDATKACISAASQIINNESINVLITGFNCEDIAADTAKLNDVDKVIYCDNELYSSTGLTENISNLICSIVEKYSFSHVLGGISSFGKDVIPRCCGILDLSQISDCTKIIDDDTFERSIYAGNAVCNVKSKENIKFITIRSTSFDTKIETSESKNGLIEKYDTAEAFKGKEFIGDELTASVGPSLTSATSVVSGGRGMKSGENFEMLHELCELIPDCAMGASRAAVDAGYVGNDLQIGQTGKCVAPNLYIAVGISGAIQHIAGMKDSKLIIAINNDQEAPIFSIADYGLVADLFQVVPKLTDMLVKAAK